MMRWRDSGSGSRGTPPSTQSHLPKRVVTSACPEAQVLDRTLTPRFGCPKSSFRHAHNQVILGGSHRNYWGLDIGSW